MSFPASQLRLAPTLDQAAATLKGLRSFALDRQSAMLAGNVGADSVLSVWERLHAAKTLLQTYAAVPGLAAYAQAQFDDGTLDVAAEFSAVLSAIDAVTAEVVSTFPVDGSGYLLAAQFGATALTYRQFTPAATATLAGLLGTLAATIS